MGPAIVAAVSEARTVRPADRNLAAALSVLVVADTGPGVLGRAVSQFRVSGSLRNRRLGDAGLGMRLQ